MKNFFSKEKEKEKEKKEKDKDKEKTAEKTKEGDRKGGAKSDAEKQANPMRPATSGRPVRFVSATLTHLYYTIPVISSTTTLDAICKIEQKIVTLGQVCFFSLLLSHLQKSSWFVHWDKNEYSENEFGKNRERKLFESSKELSQNSLWIESWVQMKRSFPSWKSGWLTDPKTCLLFVSVMSLKQEKRHIKN